MFNRIRAQARRWRAALRCKALDAGNRWRARPVVGDAPLIVSLTSHGERIGAVHLAIESIAAGSVRPARLLLWLNARPDAPAPPLPAALQRLVGRGLEIRYCEDYGPHTKYFPALPHAQADGCALVTADDDVLYPPWWLERLHAAHRRQPEVVWCYRARRVTLDGSGLGRYADWDFDPGCAEPSVLNFATGVSGVIYPLPVVHSLLAAGEGFRQRCPKQDDIWLHYVEVRAGHPVAQVGREPMLFDRIPETEHSALHPQNMGGGHNDLAIKATYDQAAHAILARVAAGDAPGR
jgi:hypothetical protein